MEDQNMAANETSSGSDEEVENFDAPVESSSNKHALPGILGVQSLLTFFILAAAWMVAFSSRLFAVVRFESIIHEFDPW